MVDLGKISAAHFSRISTSQPISPYFPQTLTIKVARYKRSSRGSCQLRGRHQLRHRELELLGR